MAGPGSGSRAHGPRCRLHCRAGAGRRNIRHAGPRGGGAAWLAVVGLRDLAFGGYILALARLSTRCAVGVVLGVTAVIPLGDVLILLAVRGLSSPGHLLLHLASAGVMAAAAAWMLRHQPSAEL
ncbi:DUF4267 domain-containing protein [Siccirubricoccus deserti]